MPINVAHAFNQKGGYAVFKLLTTTVLSDHNLDKKQDFLDFVFHNLGLISSVINNHFPAILRFLHKDHCSYFSTCETFIFKFLKMLDLDKIHVDYLKACADNNPLLKGY